MSGGGGGGGNNCSALVQANCPLPCTRGGFAYCRCRWTPAAAGQVGARVWMQACPVGLNALIPVDVLRQQSDPRNAVLREVAREVAPLAASRVQLQHLPVLLVKPAWSMPSFRLLVSLSVECGELKHLDAAALTHGGSDGCNDCACPRIRSASWATVPTWCVVRLTCQQCQPHLAACGNRLEHMLRLVASRGEQPQVHGPAQQPQGGVQLVARQAAQA